MLIKNNKLYDVLKWIVITVSPALCTLITGLGLLYGFDSSIIVGTITLLTTFVGALVGISAVQYNKTVNAYVEAQDKVENTLEEEVSNDENGN